jgi:hypothetical protein
MIFGHNGVRRGIAAVVSAWGLPVAQESREMMMPGSEHRVDLMVAGAGEGGGLLAVDVTRRARPFDVEDTALVAAESRKRMKYEALFGRTGGLVLVRGFALDTNGRLGPDALQVVERLAAAGALVCDGHVDDLREELLQRVAAEAQFAAAHLLAVAGFNNRDQSLGVPRVDELLGVDAPARLRRARFR